MNTPDKSLTSSDLSAGSDFTPNSRILPQKINRVVKRVHGIFGLY